MHDILDQLTQLLNARPKRLAPLSGGCIGHVFRADMPDGSVLAVKAAPANGTLDIEAYMLRYLAERSSLPVPRVVHGAPELLVMEFIHGDSRFTVGAERHAAELLAGLHACIGPHFGFHRDTLIGGLTQTNAPSRSWVEFFRDERLLHMADQADESGSLGGRLHEQLRRLAKELPNLIQDPDQPALIHGDVWTTNVLAAEDRVTAFLDPAIYYADPEVELASITLFDTFGRAFFDRYQELRPIRPGFFETRRHIYNLYPLLVHVRLFGGSYASQIADSLEHLGF